MTLERKEQKRRVSAVDWPKQLALLNLECGLWPDQTEDQWRLDGSEGPLRMRARLERIGKSVDSIPQRPLGRQREAIPQNDELSSAVSRINAAPWDDPFALALGEAAESAEEGTVMSSRCPLMPAATAAVSQAPELATVAEDAEADTQSISWAEEETSDKQRRIAKTLQSGDVVEEVSIKIYTPMEEILTTGSCEAAASKLRGNTDHQNIVRIVGVDALRTSPASVDAPDRNSWSAHLWQAQPISGGRSGTGCGWRDHRRSRRPAGCLVNPFWHSCGDRQQ